MKRTVRTLVLVSLLAGASASTARADGSWAGNGSYCGGSSFSTCFSIAMTWTGNVVRLEFLNAAGEDDLIYSIGLFNLPAGAWTYALTAGTTAGFDEPPSNDLSNFPSASAYGTVLGPGGGGPGSAVSDGNSGVLYITFSGVVGNFDSFIQNASVGGHFASGPEGCSTKPIVTSEGIVNQGPYDEACGGTSVPEPATMVLLATGLVGLAGAGAIRRRRQHQDA